ncbi:MAG: c-type cytochrome, partial [Pirellulales bacterium]
GWRPRLNSLRRSAAVRDVGIKQQLDFAYRSTKQHGLFGSCFYVRSNTLFSAGFGRLARSVRILAIALACLLSGCDFPGRPNPADRPVRSDQVVDFDRLFQQNCAGCHGVDGTMGPAPPLNDAIFLTIVSDEDLLRVIREGRPDTPMAAFVREHGGPLTEAQVEALAAGLKPRWKSKVDERLDLPPYQAERQASSPSTEEPTMGAAAFARACAPCHGEQGEGTSEAGPINDPAFLALVSDQALRRLIITGRPDLRMPNFAENHGRGDDYQPLSSAEIDELVALLDSWRRRSPAALLKETSTASRRLSADTKGRTP